MKPRRESARRPGRPSRAPGLVRLAVYVPEDLKRWLQHRAIDERKDMGILVTEAIQRLAEQRAERARERDRRR